MNEKQYNPFKLIKELLRYAAWAVAAFFVLMFGVLYPIVAAIAGAEWWIVLLPYLFSIIIASAVILIGYAAAWFNRASKRWDNNRPE